MLDTGVDPTPRTAEQEAAEIDEDVEDYRAALHARKAQMAAAAQVQIDGGRLGEISEIAAQKWKEQEAMLEAKIEVEVHQYREMCIATAKWEKGITGPKVRFLLSTQDSCVLYLELAKVLEQPRSLRANGFWSSISAPRPCLVQTHGTNGSIHLTIYE